MAFLQGLLLYLSGEFVRIYASTVVIYPRPLSYIIGRGRRLIQVHISHAYFLPHARIFQGHIGLGQSFRAD